MNKKQQKKQSDAQKKTFIRLLAEYISGDSANKSIRLEMGMPGAVEWAAIRNATPIFGYVTAEETEKILKEWFGR